MEATINSSTMTLPYGCRVMTNGSWVATPSPGWGNSLVHRAYRQQGEDLEQAIIRSVPEVLYHYGEFTFLGPRFVRWSHRCLGRAHEDVKEDLRYIHDHLGTTLSGHFAALMCGLEDYAKACGTRPDWQLLYETCYALILDMAAHYEALERRMLAEEEKPEPLRASQGRRT